MLLVIGLAWGLSCEFALNSLRGQLEARLIQRAARHIGPDTASVLDFAKASAVSIEIHSPLDAQLYGELADFCSKAGTASSNPHGKLRLSELSLTFRARASQLEPLGAVHSLELARAYLGLQRIEQAQLYAERAFRLQPHSPWIRANIAASFLAYGHTESAELYLAEARRVAAAEGIKEAKPYLDAVAKRFPSGGTPVQ